MLLIRVSLVLLAALVFPASALADLRSPVLGETSMLSSLIPQSRTYPPAIASDGNTTFVAYAEETGGVTVQRISATGTEIGSWQWLQSRGTVSTEDPQVVATGENVYVAWIQASYWTPEKHAVVASSHDGGRTFGQAVMAGPHTTGGGGWDLELAADGDNVFVAFVDNKDRVWTAGSRDGGRTFPCMAEITVPGDRVNGGGDYDLAVDGDTVIWTWLSQHGMDLMVRRSTDAGRTIEPPQLAYANPAYWNYPGAPRIAADDGVAAIVFSKEYQMPRGDRSGTDFGWEPEALTSGDRGATWSHHHIGGEASRCVGDYCAAPYAVDVDDEHVYVAWRAKGTMWMARSSSRGAGFPGPTAMGPYLYGIADPFIDARGENVAATWYTGVRSGSWDIDVVSAFSSDHGQTFTMNSVATGEQRDLFPVATAWGPDPAGAGFAWWSWDDNYYRGDTHVKFAPMSAAQPDIEVIDVRPQQAAQDAARLAAGRPTTIRTMLRSRAPIRATVSVKAELAYDDENGRVERTIEEDVVIRPGLNPVQLLDENPVKPAQGRITAKVTVNPNVADSDPTNNTGEGSRAVVQPRPLKILFVPVAADDELAPACRDVRDVADGTLEFLKAAWPVDPARTSVVTDCSSTLVHPAGLTEAGLMESGMLMSRIDRLKWSAEGVDKVVGVVPQGWFSRQQIDGFAEAVGVAPHGGGLDAAIVERQNTGGWVVAHELAHNYGWTETPGAHDMHLDDEPAPGYWVLERRDIPSSTLDIMQFNTAGADVASPTGRWMSKKTWDYLTTTLSTGVIQGLAAGDALSLSGSVSQSGAVTAGPAYELPGEADAGEGGGPLTLEQLDAGGGVLQTRRFGAVNELGPIGNATSKGDKHIVTAAAGFSLRVPALDGARTLRIRRGEDVLHTRTRSAAAPVVQVETPGRVELGADLTIGWQATDADGGTLTSLVSISLDGGRTWRSLGDATTGSSLTVKAIAQIAGQDVRVRVTTTDDWNTTSAESGAFVIGGQLTDGLVVFSDFPSGGIWTASMDGSDAKRISDRGQHPRWSPDGRKIVFSDGSNIFTIDADGGNRRKLTDLSGNERYLTPFWTPDGDKIVTEWYRLGTHEAWVLVDPETGERTPWVQQHGNYCGYSRDGSRIVQWGWYYQFGYALLRADGTDRQLVPQPIQGRSCMTLSPDGRYGVTKKYRSDSDSRIDIIVWDLQTKEERNLTNGQYGGYNGYSTWSPTGEWILWGSNKDRGGATGYGATDIWKIRPDGTGATKIVDGANPYHNFEHPDVQPRRGVAPDPEPTLEERKPEAVVAAATGVEGTQIALDAKGSKTGAEDAAIVSYGWDLDGDGTYTDAEGVAPKARFHDEGTYTVGVLVTDAAGKTDTAAAEITVTNVAPAITDARVDDGEPASFSAKLSDSGTGDVLTAEVFWNGSGTGETVPVISGSMVIASRPGATSAKLVVSDGDGGEAEATAIRVAAPPNAVPSAADATASVVAGEAVDIDLPAHDPEGAPLEYEIVDQPADGSVQMRDPLRAPSAPDVTYVAGRDAGTVTFTYRVKDGAGQSGVATVTVDVTARPDDPDEVVVPGERPVEPDQPPAARPSREGGKPIDQRDVEELTGESPAVITRAEQVATLPSSRSCVSRRNFRIRVKKGDYRSVTVRMNGKRVKVLRGLRDTATVDLRGLPKGRFKVEIAVTLKSGRVVRFTRQYRTCAPKKKGGRA